jgi:hypothetical protein
MHDYLSIFKHTLRLRNKTFNDPISIFGDKKNPPPQECFSGTANCLGERAGVRQSKWMLFSIQRFIPTPTTNNINQFFVSDALFHY